MIPFFMLGTALRAFHSAKRRFEASSNTPTPLAEDLYIPLAESLWWAVSVDEGFARIDGPDYGTERDADTSGRIFRGLKYARNRCGHQRALAIKEQGLALPARLPFTLGVYFRWRPLADLPPADPAFRDARGARTYEEWLAGRPATRTLEAMAQWFAHAQNRPSSSVRQQLGTFSSYTTGALTPNEP